MALFCPLGPCLPLARSGQEASNCGWLLRLALASEVPLLALVPHYHGQSLNPSRYRTQYPTQKAVTLPQAWTAQHGGGGLEGCPRGVPQAGSPSTGRGFQMDELRGGLGQGTMCGTLQGTDLSLSCSLSGGKCSSPAFSVQVLKKHPCYQEVGHIASPQKGKCYLHCDRV